MAFTQLKLGNNHLNLQSVPSFTVGQKLLLDNANEKLTWSDNTDLILSGGVQLNTNGSLDWKKSDNLNIGDITLNGGSLTIGDTSAQTFEIGSDIVLQADSTIKFNSGSTLKYAGSALAVSKALTLEGSGQMKNTNVALNISGATGKLNLSGVSLEGVITSANNSGLSIDNSSIVTDFSVSNLTPVSIASGKNLSGNITINAGGTVRLNDAGTLAASSSLTGGTLEVNQSSTVSGVVSIAGNSAINVAAGKTATFSAGVINTNNYELTLDHSGTVSFHQNSSGIVLNNADGLLKLKGTGTVQEVQVTTASNAGKGIQVNGSGTVSNLVMSADTELKIANGKTLSGSAEIAENKTLKLTSTGKLGSDLSLKGTMVASGNMAVSGKISVADNSTISIPNAQSTVNYSGGNLTINAYTLTMSGDGTFSNASNSPIVLAVEESVLDLSGNGTVTGAIQLDGCTLKASGSPTISGNITQSDDAKSNEF